MILIFTNSYYIEEAELSLEVDFLNDKIFVLVKSEIDSELYDCNRGNTKWLGNIKSSNQVLLLVDDRFSNKFDDIVIALREFISINNIEKVYIRYHKRTYLEFAHLTREINAIAIEKSHNDDPSDPFNFIESFKNGDRTYQQIIDSTFSHEVILLQMKNELLKVYKDYEVNGNFKFNKTNLDEVEQFNNRIDKIQIDFKL